MTDEQRRRLRNIKNFPQLIAFLRDELDWPIDRGEDEDDLTFDWSDDLGLEASAKVGIKEIKQLRPLESGQPWGIFFINFEKKRLPIVIMRRILNALVVKKRASANKAQRAAWQQHDLLFISAYGEDDERQLTFAHFSEPAGELMVTKPTLRVLGWDDEDTNLKLDYVADKLKEKLTWPENAADLKAWRRRWSEAFEFRHRQVINTSEELALRLAELAKRIRGRALRVLEHESEKGPLRKLMKGFRTALIHDLGHDQFADMYAQTITYGLFSAAVSRTVPGAGTAVVQENVADMVPVTNPFLKEMLESFLRAGGRKGKLDFDELGIQDVVELLNDKDTRLDAVLRDFGNRTRQEDPVIHFYEHFLTAYDKKLKVQRGVFYTPLPVVSYIVRSVHELLQTEFGLEDGLASTVTWGEMALRFPPPLAGEGKGGGIRIPDGTSPDQPFVVILDIATGTGTFFITVIEVIHQYLKTKFEKGGIVVLPRIHNPKSPIRNWGDYWNAYVPAHLLPRIFGYELMMAPYAIAHMRVPLKLKETGFTAWSELTEKNRVNIYLTNALEPASDDKKQQEFEELAPALAHEAQAVNAIKRRQRFTVVIGNPPYSNFGQLNKIPFILDLLDDYKRDLNERKLNLDDDYIKFIRLGQWLVDQSNVGILAYISANSYLDGAGHRRMRELLLTSFGMIRVVNLHGNLRKKEVGPNGAKEENVFDIMQGVAVALMRKAPLPPAEIFIDYCDLWGGRSDKYATLSSGLVHFDKIFPKPQLYLLIPRMSDFAEEYSSYLSLKLIFRDVGQGIEMGRTVAFAYSKAELESVLSDLKTSTNTSFSRKYGVPVSSATWGIDRARDDVRTSRGQYLKLMVRPFDEGWTYYTGHAGGFHHRPRAASTRNMLVTGNHALVAKRQSKESSFSSVWVVNKPINQGFFSIDPLGRESLFPLYRTPEVNGAQATFLSGKEGAIENVNGGYLCDLPSSMSGRSGPRRDDVATERVFDYIYAVLHSPTYRNRYAEYLRTDFPSVPRPGSLDLFGDLARLGGELVALHLMESPKLDDFIATYIGAKNPEVGRVGWSSDTVWLDARATKKGQPATPGTIGFRGVPEAVWNFHIGGYQVCEKWLKDRKGRMLSKDDIVHYQKVVVALNETIRLMAEIDAVIEKHSGWPAAFASN